MTPDEERLIVAKAARGDSGAFEKLVLAHQREVYNLALKLTGSPEDAMDASQDAFLKAYRSLPAFRGESRFSVWLYRLTYNASMDIIKKSRKTVPLPTDEEDTGLELPDPAPSPEEEAERRETRRLVREALSQLPADKREILMMREYAGMSYTDIALTLGISEGTVKSRLARARMALAENLKKHGTFSDHIKSKKYERGRENE